MSAEVDDQLEMEETATENKPWQGSEVDAPPYNPHPPVRSIGVLSTTRREPRWTMAGRGEEMCFEYTQPHPRCQFVRARLIQTRPVPEKKKEEPQNYMTHQIEYIVGGIGLEWVRLDEDKKKIKQKLGFVPADFEGEPFFVVPYKILTAESSKQPAPGEYPIVSTCSNRLSPHQKTARLDGRLERFSTSHERKAQMPDPAAYEVKELHTSKSSPCCGFGSMKAQRFQEFKKEQAPEMGAYPPKSSFSEKSFYIPQKRKEKAWNDIAPRGSEPGRYDVEKGLVVIESNKPICRLNLSSQRPPVECAISTTKEVGPGTYDSNHKLVQERRPVMIYKKAQEERRRRRQTHDRPLSVYTTIL